jgi:hypothetical protein
MRTPWQARANLDTVLDLLTKLDDARAVRLIAPLLAENATLISSGTEKSTPAQERASFSLRELGLHGAIVLGVPGSHAGLDILRVWWNENHEKYGPVPEPLRTIDDARSLAQVTDIQPAIPSGTRAADGPLVWDAPEARRPSHVHIWVGCIGAILVGAIAAEVIRRRKGRSKTGG